MVMISMEDLGSGVTSIIIPFLSLIMRLFMVLILLVTMVYLARFGSRADAVVAKHLAFLIELAGGTLHRVCRSVSATCRRICCEVVGRIFKLLSELSMTMGAET